MARLAVLLLVMATTLTCIAPTGPTPTPRSLEAPFLANPTSTPLLFTSPASSVELTPEPINDISNMIPGEAQRNEAIIPSETRRERAIRMRQQQAIFTICIWDNVEKGLSSEPDAIQAITEATLLPANDPRRVQLVEYCATEKDYLEIEYRSAIKQVEIDMARLYPE